MEMNQKKQKNKKHTSIWTQYLKSLLCFGNFMCDDSNTQCVHQYEQRHEKINCYKQTQTQALGFTSVNMQHRSHNTTGMLLVPPAVL